MMHQMWIDQAKEHWKEFQPAKFKALQLSGTLKQELINAAQQTADDMQDLVNQGFDRNQAWEMVREKYLFPPEESGQQGNEHETTDNEGYSTAMDINQMLSNLKMPGEKGD